jgi:hypothetical protein
MDVGALQHFKELTDPAFVGAGKIAKCGRDVGAAISFESEAFEFAATLLEEISLDVAGGRDNADGVAPLQGFGFDDHR